MNHVKYITNEKGKKVEVILPINIYNQLMEVKSLYDERIRILNSIQKGAEEILQDRDENHLNQELSDFIDEIEDHSN